MDWQEERFNKWNEWLNIIYSDITRLWTDRTIFLEIQEMIKNNPKIHKPSLFYSFLGNAYVAQALSGVRRQIKVHKDSISLARLLEEIRGTPEILSKSRFVALYTNDQTLGEMEFDQFARKVGNHIDPDLVASDLDELRKKVKTCEDYVDRRVAHFDKREVKDMPTFADLDACIDLLWELLKKYYLLFRALSLSPSVCQPDWREIFKEPWLP